MEYCKERMSFIDRKSLGTFYSIVRNSYMKDKKALSNKVLNFLENADEYIWTGALKQLSTEDLDSSGKSADKLIKYGSTEDFNIFIEKKALTKECVVKLFFSRGQMSVVDINEKINICKKNNMFVVEDDINDSFLQYAIKNRRLSFITNADISDETKKSCLVETEDYICDSTLLFILITELENLDQKYIKDKDGLDIIQRFIRDQKFDLIDMNVIKKLVETDYNMFKDNYSLFNHTDENIKKMIKDNYPEKVSVFEKKLLVNIISDNNVKKSSKMRL